MYLGKLVIILDSCLLTHSCASFGLLHRIPPIPEDREPGAIPLELTEQPEFEEQQLFVPADLTEGMETPEQTEERLQWEQEEMERESYARNYATAINPSSNSAYDLSSDSEPKVSRYTIDSASKEHDMVNVSEVPPAKSVPVMTRDIGKPPPLPLTDAPRPSTPVRTATSPVPRSLTPTQSRPYGFHISGESRS